MGEVSQDSIAYQAGFRSGDELLAVGDRDTPTWETAVSAMLAEAEAFLARLDAGETV